MTFKDFINEEWKTSLKFGKDTLEIFKNPTNFQEPKHPTIVRGILDSKGDLYVWDARKDYLHYEVGGKMGMDVYEKDIPLVFNSSNRVVEINFYYEPSKTIISEFKIRVKNNKHIQKYMNIETPRIDINII